MGVKFNTMEFITLEQQAKNIVYQYAGSPTELQRQLKQIKIRYVVVRRGGMVKYVLRGKGINRTEVKL